MSSPWPLYVQGSKFTLVSCYFKHLDVSSLSQQLSSSHCKCKRAHDTCGTCQLQVFEGLISGPDGTRAIKRELTPQEKKRRVVLKRVNLDMQGVRANFLRSGTMARVSARACIALLCQAAQAVKSAAAALPCF